MEFNKVTISSACKACKNPLKHEDQVVVAKAANFYHLKCYKRLGFIKLLILSNNF